MANGEPASQQGIVDVTAEESPKVCGNPLPLDIRKIWNHSRPQLRPFDGGLLILDQRKHLGVVAVDTNEVVMDSLTPSVKVSHVSIIGFELLARFLPIY